jgi:hypothetical protein
MLPALFSVLLALNLALFWWGRQHEIPIEPPLPPLLEAPHEIQLLSGGPSADRPPAPESESLAGPADAIAPPGEASPPATPETVEAEPITAEGAPTLDEDDTEAPDEGAPPDAQPMPEEPAAPVPNATTETEQTSFPNPGIIESPLPAIQSTEPEADRPIEATEEPKATETNKPKRHLRKPASSRRASSARSSSTH